MAKRLESSQQIKIGAVLSYLSIGVNIAAGLIYTPWMIGKIGQSEYGLFTLANSLISLFMIDFGLSAATSKFISGYHVQGEEERANEFLGIIYKLYIAIDMIMLTIFVVLFFFLDRIYVNLTPREIEQLKVVYCIAGLYSIVSFPFVTTNGVLIAYEKFVHQKIADLLYRVLSTTLMVIALINGYGLYALVTINAITGIVVIIYKLLVIKSSTPIKINFHTTDKTLYRTIFSFSTWTTIASLAQRLVFNITPSILGMVANSSSIAVFGIVTTIESYAFTFTNAINGMFMPKISKIYSGGDENKNILALMLKVGRFQFVLNSAIIVGFAVIGKEFVQLWMGEAYSEAYYGILLVRPSEKVRNPVGSGRSE